MLRDVWGSKNVRLGAESMRHFDQCCLCLGSVQAPVVCGHGHLFCRECILASLLEQKRDMAALKTTLEQLARQHDLERQRVRQEAVLRVQRDFERAQAGSSTSQAAKSSADAERQQRRRSRSPHRSTLPTSSVPSSSSSLAGTTLATRGRSRSPSRAGSSTSSLADLPARIAAQKERAIADTMERLEQEQAEAKKHKIPAYWLPSLTPSADANSADVVRRAEDALESKGMVTKCYVADRLGHPTSIKSLVDVSFVEERDAASSTGNNAADDGAADDSLATTPARSTGDAQPAAGSTIAKRKICPSCRKTLSDVAHLYVLRRCGHVHCASCVDRLLMPALKHAEKAAAAAASTNGIDNSNGKGDRPGCLDCGTTIKSAAKDLIPLQREGTGFASGGMSESKQKGISFQG